MERKLNKSKIRDIIPKINELVEIYAKKFQLEKYVIEEVTPFHLVKTTTENDINTKMGFVNLKKINFKQFIIDRDNPNYPEVNEFLKKISSFVSNIEIETIFIKKYYAEYATILYIIEVLFFDTPRPPEESDFEYLNALYKKYTTNNDTKTADNKN